MVPPEQKSPKSFNNSKNSKFCGLKKGKTSFYKKIKTKKTDLCCCSKGYESRNDVILESWWSSVEH